MYGTNPIQWSPPELDSCVVREEDTNYREKIGICTKSGVPTAIIMATETPLLCDNS